MLKRYADKRSRKAPLEQRHDHSRGRLDRPTQRRRPWRDRQPAGEEDGGALGRASRLDGRPCHRRRGSRPSLRAAPSDADTPHSHFAATSRPYLARPQPIRLAPGRKPPRNPEDGEGGQIEESVARYLHQLDSADRQEPSLARTTKSTRLKEKIAKLKEEMERLKALDVQMLATPDQQISLTDPDARSMATSGRGSGVVGYNVQVAVDTKHHLIVTHEVTNVGNDRSHLASVAKQAKDTL